MEADPLSKRRLKMWIRLLGVTRMAESHLREVLRVEHGTTLPRFGASLPLETSRMRLRRRISATYKDLPGGQVLGPTFDYTHRLLDFALAAEGRDASSTPEAPANGADVPRVTEILAREGLMQRENTAEAEPGDLTREPLPVTPKDPAFHRCYVSVGDFPEVNVGPKWLLVRMLTAFGAGLVPIL